MTNWSLILINGTHSYLLAMEAASSASEPKPESAPDLIDNTNISLGDTSEPSIERDHDPPPRDIRNLGMSLPPIPYRNINQQFGQWPFLTLAPLNIHSAAGEAPRTAPTTKPRAVRERTGQKCLQK